MKKLALLLLVFLVISCTEESQETLENGYYRVALTVQDNEQLPFIIKVNSSTSLTIFLKLVMNLLMKCKKKDSIYELFAIHMNDSA